MAAFDPMKVEMLATSESEGKIDSDAENCHTGWFHATSRPSNSSQSSKMASNSRLRPWRLQSFFTFPHLCFSKLCSSLLCPQCLRPNMRPHVSTSLLGITPHHEFPWCSFFLKTRLQSCLPCLPCVLTLAQPCLLPILYLASYIIISYYILSTL